uniref:Uncharacterized protein n=1 Tax=Anguilla anguilla TaxID=7936 RepID=A0A0E9WII6_ANGAN
MDKASPSLNLMNNIRHKMYKKNQKSYKQHDFTFFIHRKIYLSLALSFLNMNFSYLQSIDQSTIHERFIFLACSW